MAPSQSVGVTIRISRLRLERMRRGAGAADVAAVAGIDASTLTRIELGKITPNRRTARALFAYYEGWVSLGDIYDPMFSPVEVIASQYRRAQKRTGQGFPPVTLPVSE